MHASASSPRICIHRAGAGDAHAIARFERRLPAAVRRAGGRTAPLAGQPGSTVSVIARDRDSGIVVGHAVASPAPDGTADVAVRVAEAYEQHDIGRKLLEQLVREARGRGVRAELPE